MGGSGRSTPPPQQKPPRRPAALPADLESALRAWPALGAEDGVLDARRIGTGLLHASYALRTRRGEYVAQRVNPLFSRAIHGNIRAVTRHLAARGCTTIALCETASGDLSVDVPDGGVWRVMERLPGVTFETCARPAQARSAGAAVGAFHAALADFEAPLAPLGIPYHDTDGYVADLDAALRQHGDHPRAGDVGRLAHGLVEALETWRPPPDLPPRVLHGDLKFSNVLFEGESPPAADRAVALIDLDTVCRLPLYFDLGDAWRSWSNRRAEDEPEAELDPALFAAAAEGWLSAGPPLAGAAERASLEGALEVVTLELCVRFATDVLRERYFAWDPERFPSAAEHNWLRARGQWSLFEQARDTAPERLRALRD